MKKNDLMAAIVKKGLNVEKLAKLIGISSSSFYNKMNGCSEFSREEMIGIKNHLELSEADFLDIFFSEEVS